MQSEGFSMTAFVLALIAGILILVNAIFSSLFLAVRNYGVFGDGIMGNGMMGGWSGMMRGFDGMMGVWGFSPPLMAGFSVLNLVAGAIVLIGAFMILRKPANHVAWGAAIVAFSVISLIGMGGYLVGALLGIAGGAIALSWKTSSKPNLSQGSDVQGPRS